MKFGNEKTRKKFNSDIVNTVVGEEAQFVGKLDTQRSIKIEGGLEGEINSQGDVYIGENSRVKANIIGKNVIVAGEVIGNIETLKGLHIARTGRVYGDISGDHLIIEEGAIYKGKVNMDVISSKNAYEGSIELNKK
ncbi:MAG: cytoskeletal protein CcmA (bactofilin family) [Candidatus Marinamargulisbacteria bacterium]|jgi:cytoskeletal protein CcmA (bactofilin family)